MAEYWDDESGAFLQDEINTYGGNTYDMLGGPQSMSVQNATPIQLFSQGDGQNLFNQDGSVNSDFGGYQPMSIADSDSGSGSSFWSQLSKSLGNLPLDKLATAGLGIYGATQASGAISDAASRAAELQQQSSLAQMAQAQKMYDQSRSDFAPYMQRGYQGLQKLQNRDQFSPNAVYSADRYRSPYPQTQPQQLGMSDTTASALMGSSNLSNDEVIKSALRDTLGFKAGV